MKLELTGKLRNGNKVTITFQSQKGTWRDASWMGGEYADNLRISVEHEGSTEEVVTFTGRTDKAPIDWRSYGDYDDLQVAIYLETDLARRIGISIPDTYKQKNILVSTEEEHKSFQARYWDLVDYAKELTRGKEELAAEKKDMDDFHRRSREVSAVLNGRGLDGESAEDLNIRITEGGL
jgi:hypothetical protein